MADPKANSILQSGVGCDAKVFGGGDTVFTIIDIISDDSFDPRECIVADQYLNFWWNKTRMIIKVEVSKI